LEKEKEPEMVVELVMKLLPVQQMEVWREKKKVAAMVQELLGKSDTTQDIETIQNLYNKGFFVCMPCQLWP
jgi:hypothetical protein